MRNYSATATTRVVVATLFCSFSVFGRDHTALNGT